MKKRGRLLTVESCEDKILSCFSYEIQGTQIVLGKKRYEMRKLRLLAFIVRYLGVVLLVLGIMRILAGQTSMGIFNCLAAIMAVSLGWIYRILVKRAYRANGLKFR